MNLIDFAKLIDGIEYPARFSKETISIAKTEDFVIVNGLSDDILSFNGAIDDEFGAYLGCTVYLDRKGVIRSDCDSESCPYFLEKINNAKSKVEARLTSDGWQIETTIPCVDFKIIEDGETYCVGKVFRFHDIE